MTKHLLLTRLQLLLCIAIYSTAVAMAGQDAFAVEKDKTLSGIWFTCEFAKRTSPPEDGCVMLDDEGFEVTGEKIYYLRNKWSDETACKGNKKGQCFRLDEKKIKVKRRKVGRIQIEDNMLKVKYLGCTQHYNLSFETGFVAVKPAKDKCIWATERHFYVTRYLGQVDTP